MNRNTETIPAINIRGERG